MKKNQILKVSLLSLLSLSVISCASGDNRTLSDLKDFKIVYDVNTSFNEDTIANELKEAILTNNEYQGLQVEGIESLDSNLNQIYLKVDSTLDENTYKIQRLDNTFILTSDSNDGLIKSCHDFLENIQNPTSSKLANWYKKDLIETYTPNEKVKVMSYNVRVGNDTQNASGEDCSRASRAPRIAKVIKQFMPDTLGVQEFSEEWKSLLNNELMPQYGFIGYGRNADLTSETSGIFYNKDTVSLIDAGTKWMSPTPDTPGTKFEDSGNWNRIFTYGVFERHSDSFTYLHINTHFDLERSPRLKGAEVINSFLQEYIDKMPIVLTGDFNNDKKDDDAVRWFISNCGYTDSMVEDKDASVKYTYPTEGYYKEGVFTPGHGGTTPTVIDYILQPNNGFICEQYTCFTEKVVGKDGTAAGPTSDHYPVICELLPYSPFISFKSQTNKKSYPCVDNTFSDYDKDYNFLDTTSNYTSNHLTLNANEASHNGQEKTPAKTRTKYTGIGNLNTNGAYIEYSFNSTVKQKADLVLTIASSCSSVFTSQNGPMDKLSDFAYLRLNQANVNIDNVSLRNTDISQYYEWEQLVLKDVDLKEGNNTVRFEVKKYGEKTYTLPNQLLLEVFANNPVSK